MLHIMRNKSGRSQKQRKNACEERRLAGEGGGDSKGRGRVTRSIRSLFVSSGSLTACPSSGLAGQGIWPKTEAVSGVTGLSHKGCSGTANHLDRVLSASRKTASNTNKIAEVNVDYENKQY